jgi:hypothetical protein
MRLSRLCEPILPTLIQLSIPLHQNKLTAMRALAAVILLIAFNTSAALSVKLDKPKTSAAA